MRYIMIEEVGAYENDGHRHQIEVVLRVNDNSYIILVDGAFYADASNIAKARDEVEDIIRWFGWSRVNRIYA